MIPYISPYGINADLLPRVILVEYKYINESGDLVSGYASNCAYVSSPADLPTGFSNRAYDPIVVEDIFYRRSVSWDLSQGATTSKGDIVLLITDELEHLMYADFIGQPLVVLAGHANYAWYRFAVMMRGVCSGAKTSGRKLILSFRDDGDELNRPFDLQTVTTSSGAVLPVPLVFGRCYNVTPILVNDATKKYKVSASSVSAISAIRDNGVDITSSATINVLSGDFTLSSAPSGVVTCDVDYLGFPSLSTGGYWSMLHIFPVVQYIFNEFTSVGDTWDSLIYNNFLQGFHSSASILGSLSSPSSGFYVTDSSVTKLDVVNQLLRSLGFFWIFNRGYLEFRTLNVKTAISTDFYTPDFAGKKILPSNIKYGSINLKQVVRGCTYCAAQANRNWTVLTNIAGSVTNLYTRKRLGSDYNDNATQGYTNSLSSGVTLVGGTRAGTYNYPPMHLGVGAVYDELKRRAHYHQYDRLIYEMEIVSFCTEPIGWATESDLNFEVGDIVWIDYEYFGFYNENKKYTVLSINENISKGTAVIEVMVSKEP